MVRVCSEVAPTRELETHHGEEHRQSGGVRQAVQNAFSSGEELIDDVLAWVGHSYTHLVL